MGVSAFCRTLFAAVLAFSAPAISAQAQGLKFQGMDHRINERTSYDVFGGKHVRLDGKMDISFSMCTYKEADFGYILRIIDGGKTGIIWNLSYDRGDNIVLRLNEEGRFSLIKAEIPAAEIQAMHWVDVGLRFDSVCDSVFLSVGPHRFSAPAVLPDIFVPDIGFGRSDFIIDVPSFAIRDLLVSDGKTRYSFPLDEADGAAVYDLTYKIKGHVTNPTWLIRESLEWRPVATLKLSTNAGADYDPVRKCFYYFSRDTLYTYDVISNTAKVQALPSPMRVKLGTNFIKDGKLYAYETYNDDQPEGDPTLACLDPDVPEWTVLGSDHLERPVHHHASFFHEGRYEIFGGFGDKIYNGDFYVLTEDRLWEKDSLANPETLFPRYFTAIGQQGDSVYVYGGMGNECGEQIVGRRYFYDLHRIDLRTGTCEKLWELDWKEEDCVPARTMVLDGDLFYVLCYPEYLSNSHIDLCAFSLQDGTMRRLADDIPIISDKMLTNAALYLDRDLKKFFVTTLVFDDDIRSTLRIYSLAYPPRSVAEVSGPDPRTKLLIGIGLLALLLLAVAGSYWMSCRRRSRARQAYMLAKGHPEKKKYSQPDRANAIYLFGDLQVNDREGRDISGRIAAQQKQILLLLIKESGSQGISTTRLSSIIWPDKEEEKVKNSRGVAINHLRKDISALDGLSIVFDKGYYRLEVEEPAYCDVMDLLDQVKAGAPDIDRILSILSRGRFMKHVDDPVFDSFKNRIEEGVSQILQDEIVRRYKAHDWQEVIEIADMIVHIDPLDEAALKYAVSSLVRIQRKEDALLRYAAYAAEYRKENGSEYPVPFEKTVL